MRALEKAYELYRNNERDHGMDRLREKARKFALKYDADRVLNRLLEACPEPRSNESGTGC